MTSEAMVKIRRSHGRAARQVPGRRPGAGVKDKVAERVFELMEKFAGYGFNKAHATAYGIVAYQTASRRTTRWSSPRC